MSRCSATRKTLDSEALSSFKAPCLHAFSGPCKKLVVFMEKVDSVLTIN